MPGMFVSEAEIERIGEGLLDRSLPKAQWTHAAHFAAVLWLLHHRGEPAVSAELPNWIRAYNEVNGVANTDTSGYHETITIASIQAAHKVLVAHHSVPLHHVANFLLAGELGRVDWLLRYWSRPRLFSAEARNRWIAPDIADLPD